MNAEEPELAGEELHNQRWELLHHINALTEKPMIGLAFVWVVLLIVDFTSGLNRPLQIVGDVIWGLFVADFLLEFTIAPKKWEYLRANWMTALSLLLPVFRVLRLFRAVQLLRAARVARAARSVRLLRLVTSMNRGMRATRNAMGRHRVGYLLALTTLVLFAGAAGMQFFESPASLREAGFQQSANSGLQSYGDALWWTAMLLTTLGSEYWPQTNEGRITCWLLSLYAFAIFGYITATIASYFLGKQRGTEEVETASAAGESSVDSDLSRAVEEIASLRSQMADLQSMLSSNAAAGHGERNPSSGP